MAEYSQYKSESESEKGGRPISPPDVQAEEEKSERSSDDEVVFLELGGARK